MKIVKPNNELNKLKEFENAKAKIEKQEAIIDYLAMMCDVEIPTEEGTENV